MAGYQDDGRGPRSGAGTHRAEITIDFIDHAYSIKVGDSYMFGHLDVGSGQGHGYSVTFDGNTTIVHVDVSGGRPASALEIAPHVNADFGLSGQKDGAVSMQGVHTQFPSWEAYSYRGRQATTLYQYTEQPRNGFGPWALRNGENRQMGDPWP